MAKLRVDKIASVGVSTETTGSVFFDGTGDYLEIANNTDFQFGTGDWTIEFWWNGSASGTYTAIITTLVSSNEAGTWRVGTRFNSTNKIYFSRGTGSSFTDVQFDVDVNDEEWHHIAFVRSSGTIIPFVDGVDRTADLSSGSVSDSNSMTTTNPVKIGYNSRDDAYINGFISNLRVCKGHAVYKSNFAVPTRELDVHPGPDDDRTVLLCCYDGENIFADKTGRHIIAAYGDRTSSPTPTATDSPIGITTFQPGLDRDVDNTFGPSFQGGAGYNSQNWLTLPKGTTTERFVEVANSAVSASSARGVFGGGIAPSYINTLVYITISTAGDAQDFGDLTVARGEFAGSFASSTRGVFAGGRIAPAPGTTNVTIDYVTISTIGDATDFGDLITAASAGGGCSSSTRGLTGGVSTPSAVNTIEYVTIATTGNAKDYGDLTTTVNNRKAFASPTRGVWSGGEGPINTMDYVTIQSTGNSFDFGDLSTAVRRASCLSNATRGITGGGVGSPAAVDTIQYVTIQSTGNSVDFGDLTSARHDHAGLASLVRGVFAGGHPGFSDVIDFITIATLGDATDFGDVPHSSSNDAGCSNGHGGLG